MGREVGTTKPTSPNTCKQNRGQKGALHRTDTFGQAHPEPVSVLLEAEL